MAIVCPNCSADLPEDAVFCDQCGTSLSTNAPGPTPVDEGVCPQCGTPTIPGEAFCDSCGASLAEPAIATAPPASVTDPTPEPEPAPSAPALPDLTLCPSCGADNLPESRFCSNCGIDMQEAAEAKALMPAAEAEMAPEPEGEPAPAMEAEPATEAEPPGPTGQPRLIVRDTGAEIVLPTAEGDYIVGREDPVSGIFPEIDLNAHEGEHHGVSRRHAQLTIQAGMVFVEDLDSTNFTFVNRKKLAPRAPTALSNGDEVRLGRLIMTFLE